MWVLLNNCPPAYEALFTQLWSSEDLVLVRFPGVAAGTTLHEQFRILVEQTDAEIVYFAEDDYFYLPGQFQQAVNFLKQNPDADFATPYDHPDLHSTDLHNHQRDKKVWRQDLEFLYQHDTYIFGQTRRINRKPGAFSWAFSGLQGEPFLI